MAREVAIYTLADKVTELEEAQKQKPKEGKSVAEKIAARKEHKANIERIESEIERWQQIIQSGEERQACEKSRSEEADETPAVDTKLESGVDGEVKHSMFLRKKNFKFFLRRNIECTPSYIMYLLLRYFNQSCCLSEIKILLIISNKDSYVKSIKVVFPQLVSNDLYSGIAYSKKCLLPCG